MKTADHSALLHSCYPGGLFFGGLPEWGSHPGASPVATLCPQMGHLLSQPLISGTHWSLALQFVYLCSELEYRLMKTGSALPPDPRLLTPDLQQPYQLLSSLWGLLRTGNRLEGLNYVCTQQVSYPRHARHKPAEPASQTMKKYPSFHKHPVPSWRSALSRAIIWSALAACLPYPTIATCMSARWQASWIMDSRRVWPLCPVLGY